MARLTAERLDTIRRELAKVERIYGPPGESSWRLEAAELLSEVDSLLAEIALINRGATRDANELLDQKYLAKQMALSVARDVLAATHAGRATDSAFLEEPYWDAKDFEYGTVDAWRDAQTAALTAIVNRHLGDK
jgi:hypothetical protein